MLQSFMTAAGIALVLSVLGTPAQAGTVNGVLTGDANLTPNHSTGTGKTIPVYAFYKDETSPYMFNRHYSSMHMKWTVALPPELENTPYAITSARIVLWQAANADAWNPASGQLKMFATGITGQNGFTEATWTETQGYVGPGVVSATPLQDPYLIELGTGNRAEDNLAATPYSVGTFDPSYDGSASPAEAFPITFNLDVSNSDVRQQLRDDLESGIAMWSLVGTFPAAQPGGPPATYPRLVTKEGVSEPANGTLQQAPALIMEISTHSAASNWDLY